MEKSIYNEQNIKTDIIKNNFQKLSEERKNRPNCVLLTTGSLNPIHHSHVKNLRLARAFIEKHDNHPMNVLAAYISPTHDEYVRGKIGESNWIPGEQRAELCQKAIEEEELTEFIAVSRGELQFNGFMDFDSISLTLAKYLNQTLQELKPITVVYVCGLDHFNKCPYVQSLAQEDHMACAVIYRLGANDQRIKAASEQFPNRLYYVTLEDEIEAGSLVDKSSTEIREKYRNAIEQESDDSIYKCVFEYYKNKHIK